MNRTPNARYGSQLSPSKVWCVTYSRFQENMKSTNEGQAPDPTSHIVPAKPLTNPPDNQAVPSMNSVFERSSRWRCRARSAPATQLARAGKAANGLIQNAADHRNP